MSEPTPTTDDPALEGLMAQVAEEFQQRLEGGERPDAEEHARRHPEAAAALRRLLPALEALFRAGRTSAPQGAGDAPLPAGPPGYELLGELGRGGMGVVYKARDGKLNRVVALKMILAGKYATPDELERFVSEAEAVAALRHPNVVQVYEVGRHDGLPYFTLEFVPGGSLAARLKGQPLPPPDAARLVEAVARGVQAAHDRGIVHRDLKPANVLLEEGLETPPGRCTPRVTDFGLARRVEGEGRTQTGAVLGPPPYMAPEQAAGKSKEVGPAADVWALGAILYELLTGRPPFRGATVLDTLEQVRTADPVPPSRLVGRLPRDLETICLKCLHKEPQRRYPSAQELAEDLGRFQAGRPIKARPVGWLERSWRWCRRNPAVASLLGTVAATLLLGTAVASYQANEAQTEAKEKEKQRQAADTQRQRAEQEKEEKERQRQEAVRQKVRAQNMILTATLLRVGAVFRSEPEKARALLYDEEACPPELRDFTWGLYDRWCQRHGLALKGHPSVIDSVCFSPDSKSLASASGDGTVKLWDVRTGQERLTLKGFGSVCFSPDGKTLASGDISRRWYGGARFVVIKLWGVQTGREQASLKGHAFPLTSLVFSPDGKTLASGAGALGMMGEVKLWDVQSGQERASLKGHMSSVNSLAFSPDGKTLASAGGDLGKQPNPPGEIKLWDVPTGQERLSLKGHAAAVASLCFSSDGKTLASGGGSLEKESVTADVTLWDAQTGQERLTLKGHTLPVTCVAFSPDGKTLASGSWDRTLKLWDAQTGQERLTLKEHTGAVKSVCFSPDGRTLASGGQGSIPLPGTEQGIPGELKLWDARTGQERVTLTEQGVIVFSVCFSPDGGTLAAASEDKTVTLWDVRTGQVRAALRGHTGEVRSVCFSPDGQTLASAAVDRTVTLWDVRTGEVRATLRGHTGWVSSVCFSGDGNTLASAGGVDRWFGGRPWRGEIKLWDVSTGRERITLQEEQGGVTSVAFSPDGETLASASGDGTVKLWDASAGRERTTLRGHTGGVASVAFSPDGKTLASGGGRFDARGQIATSEIRLWDVPTGQERLTLKENGNTGTPVTVTSLCFSPDGKTLACAGFDKTVKLRDAATGQERASLAGYTGCVLSVCFSPDGKTLASGGYGLQDTGIRGEIKSWDALGPGRR
jgi:eukaryotic-like serine/threonine-protein kinase